MAVDNQFKETVDALFKGMNGVVSSKTVVGDAIHIGDTIILPLVDVSFAIGAGAFHADKKDRGAGGLGGKMIPSAVLVIQNGTTRLVNIKNQDTMTKILDMVPDVIDRFKSPSEDKMTEEDVADPFGTPPTPSARSRLREPVGTVSTCTCAAGSPSFITAPLPKSFSSFAIAASNAFFLFSSFIVLFAIINLLIPDSSPTLSIERMFVLVLY